MTLLFNLREYKIYTAYDPDITFSKSTSTILQMGTTKASLGQGFFFVVVPRVWLHDKYIRFNWEGYMSAIGDMQVFINDGSYSRSNDTDFPTNDSGILLKGNGLLQTLVTKTASFSNETKDVKADVDGGTQEYCTIFFRMHDAYSAREYWQKMDWFEINSAASGVGNLYSEHFTDTVHMEKTGSTGDYGYISTGTIILASKKCHGSLNIRRTSTKNLHVSFTVRRNSTKNIHVSTLVRHETSKGLSSFLEVMSPNKNLFTFLIVRNSDYFNILVSLLLRKSDSLQFSANCVVQKDDSANIPASLILRKAASYTLNASFITRHESLSNMKATFDVTLSVDLPSFLIVRKADSFIINVFAIVRHGIESDINASFNVTQYSDVLSAFNVQNTSFSQIPVHFEVKQSSSCTLKMSFVVRHTFSSNMKATFDVTHYNDISSFFNVRNIGSSQILAHLDVQHQTSLDLISPFVVRHSSYFDLPHFSLDAREPGYQWITGWKYRRTHMINSAVGANEKYPVLVRVKREAYYPWRYGSKIFDFTYESDPTDLYFSLPTGIENVRIGGGGLKFKSGGSWDGLLWVDKPVVPDSSLDSGGAVFYKTGLVYYYGDNVNQVAVQMDRAPFVLVRCVLGTTICPLIDGWNYSTNGTVSGTDVTLDNGEYVVFYSVGGSPPALGTLFTTGIESGTGCLVHFYKADGITDMPFYLNMGSSEGRILTGLYTNRIRIVGSTVKHGTDWLPPPMPVYSVLWTWREYIGGGTIVQQPWILYDGTSGFYSPYINDPVTVSDRPPGLILQVNAIPDYEDFWGVSQVRWCLDNSGVYRYRSRIADLLMLDGSIWKFRSYFKIFPLTACHNYDQSGNTTGLGCKTPKFDIVSDFVQAYKDYTTVWNDKNWATNGYTYVTGAKGLRCSLDYDGTIVYMYTKWLHKPQDTVTLKYAKFRRSTDPYDSYVPNAYYTLWADTDLPANSFMGAETWFSKADDYEAVPSDPTNESRSFYDQFFNDEEEQTGDSVIIDSNFSRSDFGDIRFTDHNGGTLLYPWLDRIGDDGISDNYADIYVKIPDDLSKNRLIYIYYGNDDETSVSNGFLANMTQLREHKIYASNPVITFSKSNGNLKTDSPDVSLGEGFNFFVVPRAWLDGKYVRWLWKGDASWATMPFCVYVYDGAYDRQSDTDFPNQAPILAKGNGQLQIVKERDGTFDWVTDDVLIDASGGVEEFCTLFFYIGDGYNAQNMQMYIDWIEINASSGGGGNIDTILMSGSVIMEKTGSTGDYGWEKLYVSPGPTNDLWGPQEAQDSSDLKAFFLIRRSASKTLHAFFGVSHWTNLLASFVVKNKASSNLLSHVVVRHSSSNVLPAYFTIRKSDYSDMATNVTVRNNSSCQIKTSVIVRHAFASNLKAFLGVSHWIHLPSFFIVRQSALTNISSSFVVRHSDILQVHAYFIVLAPGSSKLFGYVVVRHAASSDTKGSFVVRHPSSLSLSAFFIVRHYDLSDFKESLIVRNRGSKNLKVVMGVSHWINFKASFELPCYNLNASIIVRNVPWICPKLHACFYLPETKNIKAFVVVQHFADLHAYFVILPGSGKNLKAWFSTLHDSHRILREDDFSSFFDIVESLGSGVVGLPIVTNEIPPIQGVNQGKIFVEQGAAERARLFKIFGFIERWRIDELEIAQTHDLLETRRGSHQQNIFLSDSRYWWIHLGKEGEFGNLYLQSLQEDDDAWGIPDNLTTGDYIEDHDYDSFVQNSNLYLAYQTAAGAQNLLFRKAFLDSNGTWSWLGSAQTVFSGGGVGNKINDVSITVFNNAIYISFCNRYWQDPIWFDWWYRVEVWKSTDLDGTSWSKVWQSAGWGEWGGFLIMMPSMLRVMDSGIVCIYGLHGIGYYDPYAEIWMAYSSDGAIWNGGPSILSADGMSPYIVISDAQSLNDSLIVVNAMKSSSKTAVYGRNWTWGDLSYSIPEILFEEDLTDNLSVGLTKDTTANSLYAFYMSYGEGIIRSRKYISSFENEQLVYVIPGESPAELIVSRNVEETYQLLAEWFDSGLGSAWEVHKFIRKILINVSTEDWKRYWSIAFYWRGLQSGSVPNVTIYNNENYKRSFLPDIMSNLEFKMIPLGTMLGSDVFDWTTITGLEFNFFIPSTWRLDQIWLLGCPPVRASFIIRQPGDGNLHASFFVMKDNISAFMIVRHSAIQNLLSSLVARQSLTSAILACVTIANQASVALHVELIVKQPETINTKACFTVKNKSDTDTKYMFIVRNANVSALLVSCFVYLHDMSNLSSSFDIKQPESEMLKASMWVRRPLGFADQEVQITSPIGGS